MKKHEWGDDEQTEATVKGVPHCLSPSSSNVLIFYDIIYKSEEGKGINHVFILLVLTTHTPSSSQPNTNLQNQI